MATSASTAPTPRGLRALMWAGGLSATAAAIALPRARSQWSQTGQAARASYLLAEPIGSVHARLDRFVDRDEQFYGIQLHWESPTHARLAGNNVSGSIDIEDSWVRLSVQLHDHLRLHHKAVSTHIIRRFGQALANDR